MGSGHVFPSRLAHEGGHDIAGGEEKSGNPPPRVLGGLGEANAPKRSGAPPPEDARTSPNVRGG
jgi:hypothetical protein